MNVWDLEVGDFGRFECGCVIKITKSPYRVPADRFNWSYYSYITLCANCSKYDQYHYEFPMRHQGYPCEKVDGFHQILITTFHD